MALGMVLPGPGANGGRTFDALCAIVDGDGSGTHPHVRRLQAADRRAPRPGVPGPEGERRAPMASAAPIPAAKRVDLADAAHALCAVHGAPRGLADEAGEHPGAAVAADWLREVARMFADERGHLARIVAASGPLPSTPGQGMADAAWAAQRNAFRLLARADRAGVATGAAAALAMEWIGVREVLARAADAYGVALPPLGLPDGAETAIVLDLAAVGPGAERAMIFGARAVLAQHRGFWDLLEARSAARG